jgi:dihydropteroate synthase
VAAALIAVQRGARMVRVHDVAATVDALAVWRGVHAGEPAPRRDPKPAAPRWPDDD